MQENQNNQNQEIEVDENHLIQIRKDKLKELQEQGKNPFEITKFNRTNKTKDRQSRLLVYNTSTSRPCNSIY